MQEMNKKISKKVLMAKARATTTSIEKMDEKQRSSTASGEYGEDYNKLRELVAQMYPHLKELLPPSVWTYEEGMSRFTQQSYGEIDTFCEQIFQLLSEEDQA